jgi:competence protein ComEC
VSGQDDPPDLRLVLPALSAWLVAWQGFRLPPRLLLAGAAALAVAAAVVLLRSRRPRAVVAAAVCGCAAAAGLVTGLHLDARATSPLAALAREQAAVAVEGVLTADPRVAVPRGPARGGPDLVVVRLRVEQLDARGRSFALSEPVVLLTTDRDWLALLPSQRVRAEGRLRPAEPDDDVVAVLSGAVHQRSCHPPSPVQQVAGLLRAGLRQAAAAAARRRGRAAARGSSSATSAGCTPRCARTSAPRA